MERLCSPMIRNDGESRRMGSLEGPFAAVRRE